MKTLVSRLPGMEADTRLITNGHADPLYGVTILPDVLVHHITSAKNELKALIARPATARPVTLLIGPAGDPEIMRLAMQAGARDIFKPPVATAEFVAALRQVAKDKLAGASGRSARITAVINAKGGSGASLIAGNVAHILATQAHLRTALLDLDLQFGTQLLNFDLKPEQGLIEALNAVEGLDVVALQGYMAKHRSGMHVLATVPGHISLPGEISAKHLAQLLDILTTGYDHIVVDLPRLVDPLMTTVVERAEQIVFCLQQNLANMRDASRLVQVLTTDLDVPAQRLVFVVNRYHDDDSVRLADVEQVLQTKVPIRIPNDYKRVSAAANLGAPLSEYAPQAAVTRSLVNLAMTLSGRPPAEKKGLISRMFVRA